MANEKKQGEAANENQEEKQQLLFAGVTQEQLDEWKTKYGEVHIVTVHINDNESVTGYFKKADRNIMANCVNLVHDKKTYEAREFLLINTWIGGDKAITTKFDCAVVAQTKLWANMGFLTAEASKY
jgi:hypothetical protein